MAAIIRAISQMVTNGTPGQHQVQGQIPALTVPQDSLGKLGASTLIRHCCPANENRASADNKSSRNSQMNPSVQARITLYRADPGSQSEK